MVWKQGSSVRAFRDTTCKDLPLSRAGVSSRLKRISIFAVLLLLLACAFPRAGEPVVESRQIQAEAILLSQVEGDVASLYVLIWNHGDDPFWVCPLSVSLLGDATLRIADGTGKVISSDWEDHHWSPCSEQNAVLVQGHDKALVREMIVSLENISGERPLYAQVRVWPVETEGRKQIQGKPVMTKGTLPEPLFSNIVKLEPLVIPPHETKK